MFKSKYINLYSEDTKHNPKNATLVCGYFDMLHAGHVAFLEECKELAEGDLIVGVLGDRIGKKKRNIGAVIPELDRVYVLSGLSCVDYVTIYNESPVENDGAMYKKLRPTSVVFSTGEKNSDMKNKDLQFIKTHFPEMNILYVERQRENTSTTDIIARIKKYY